jgi:HTH-type transcriptional regulator / antitoxin HipB
LIFPIGKLDSVNFGKAGHPGRKSYGLWDDELAPASGIGVRFILDLEPGKPAIQLEKDVLGAAHDRF